MGRKSRAKRSRPLQVEEVREAPHSATTEVVTPEAVLKSLRASQRRILWERRRIAQAVQTARDLGLSWGAIGAALDISRQAARQRFEGNP